MDESVKICPGCGAEYFAHVESCNACAVALVFPEDLPEAPPCGGSEELVCVEEGTRERMADLIDILRKAGVEGSIFKSGRGCSDGYGLFVAAPLVQHAVAAIEKETDRLYPGLKEAEERLEAGRCPACGADVPNEAAECPDCGLNLSGAVDGPCGGGCGH